jgi:septal ring factor EnvC (AmiA/AmiB activator)
MADDLATDIRDTKAELKDVTDAIKIIRTGDDAAVKALGYGSRDEAKAHLVRLETEKEQLNEQLKALYDTRKYIALAQQQQQQQQQQQSGAGTSMLPVRQELVMFPCQSLCCMH